MTIRKWLYEDNLPISKIESNSFIDPWSLQMISDTFMLDNFYGIVCEVGGKVVGYLAITYCLEEAEINIIAVDEEYRRKGISYNLLQTAIKDLKHIKVEKLFLEVRRSNESAQALYEKCGFKYVGVRPNYYNGKEDALLMSLIL